MRFVLVQDYPFKNSKLLFEFRCPFWRSCTYLIVSGEFYGDSKIDLANALPDEMEHMFGASTMWSRGKINVAFLMSDDGFKSWSASDFPDAMKCYLHVGSECPILDQRFNLLIFALFALLTLLVILS